MSELSVQLVALKEIQALHKPISTEVWSHGMEGPVSRIEYECGTCIAENGDFEKFPCPTRRLTDKALGDS